MMDHELRKLWDPRWFEDGFDPCDHLESVLVWLDDCAARDYYFEIDGPSCGKLAAAIRRELEAASGRLNEALFPLAATVQQP